MNNISMIRFQLPSPTVASLPLELHLYFLIPLIQPAPIPCSICCTTKPTVRRHHQKPSQNRPLFKNRHREPINYRQPC